jgi:stearoyl-CoA desaturase (delta-9 desaturase)
MIQRRVAWTNVVFIGLAHALALVAIAYLIWVRCSWQTVVLAASWMTLVGLSVTGGYHRLFAHRSYKASRALQVFYLLFGAGAVQNSALRWSADHRTHHEHADEERDPYNITKGFWWAHIGWVFFHNDDRPDDSSVPDLTANRLIMFQHRWYVPLALVFGALLPAAVCGLLWGDWLGGLLVGGFLRLVLQWHATFSINSFAHWIGRQPYGARTTARDSMWTALISFGEGYHNFHHRFQADYRNGVRAWHFDPTKWFVWSMARVGVTWDLRRTPMDAVRRSRESAGTR